MNPSSNIVNPPAGAPGAAAPGGPATPEFVGHGEIAGRTWQRGEDDDVPWQPPQPGRVLPRGHPAGYEAAPEVAAAVNTALLLDKPLLVTGKPGTGKTELAERIAYEFELGPVLRFEAQSLSEANDLFYRFDYIRQMVVAKLVELGRAEQAAAAAENFLSYGALGKAILRAVPARHADLAPGLLGVLGPNGVPAPPRRSVVLIDEIDKASRDFPNDLLNGIDRMRFELRELGGRVVEGPGRDSGLHPIVVITSNSERDLPPPFLRRCVYLNIPDPSPALLASIVRKRVFGGDPPPPLDDNGLPPLYGQLLGAFVELRDDASLRYAVGTSELLDLSTAARRRGLAGSDAGAATLLRLKDALGALAKHPEDQTRVLEALAARIAPGHAV